jgi:GntR family transcriptional regulator, trigonelline degradation regulator
MKSVAPVPETEDTEGLSLRVGENKKLREKTFKVLREAIISGHFEPGTRLVERDLCEMTGVSRSSIREAFRYLESEGLVESRGIKGVFVRVLTPEAAAEIYEVRAALESEAARHFCERATDNEVEAIVAAYNTVRRAAGRDAKEYREATDRFFEILFAGAKNTTAESLMHSLRARISFLRAITTNVSTPERSQGSVDQMGNIVKALIGRDGEAAASECRRFVNRSARFAAEVLARGEHSEV